MRFAKWFHMKYSLETKYYLLISFDLIALKLLTNKMGHSFGYQILFYIFWILLPCQWYSYDIIINPQLMMSALLGFSVIVFSLFIEAWRSVISNPPKRARHAIPLVNRR